MPKTCVYVSNGESTDICVFDIDRNPGTLVPHTRVAVPGTDLPSPTSLPMAVSPNCRFLYAALRSPDFPVSGFVRQTDYRVQVQTGLAFNAHAGGEGWGENDSRRYDCP